ncbi:MAG: LodA/GoxA family CTQ-dependent oxidase [Aureispira sp.]
MNTNEIDYVSIYPPIGIARIGNAPTYFLASEIPGIAPNPLEGYKDADGLIKKQAVKFKVYAFDKGGNVLGEITSEVATINWHIHVANVKAAWYKFNNALDLPQAGVPSKYRNFSESDRAQLAITPSPIEITGESIISDNYNFNDGKFYGKEVNLGKVETDNKGRVIFIPGDGDAHSKDNKPPITFANNEGWHDDTCDGIVRATVEISGESFEAKPAMVAVTPPNFGQGLFGVVTMNDVVQNLFIREMNYPDSAAKGVVFYEHIYPMLERMTNTQWVNEGFSVLFGHNSPSDFTNPSLLKILEDPSEDCRNVREKVFKWFRDPNSLAYEPQQVPAFYGDGFGEYEELAIVDLPITPTQYERLRKWAQGAFTKGTPAKKKVFEELSLEEQIDALNQAPLEECLGGPFHPGIELTWPMRVKTMWEEPYRLKVVGKGEPTDLEFGPLLSPQIALSKDGPLSKSGPGSLTRWLGVPWQTDEASCLSGYNPSTYLPLPSFWAARVPNQVLSEDGFERVNDENVNIAQRLKHFDYRQDWLRDLGPDYLKKLQKMVNDWHHLGIVAKQEDSTQDSSGFLPQVAWVESGRAFPERDPSFEQVEYAEETILEAVKQQGSSEEPISTRALLSTKDKSKVLRRTKKATTYRRDEM